MGRRRADRWEALPRGCCPGGAAWLRPRTCLQKPKAVVVARLYREARAWAIVQGGAKRGSARRWKVIPIGCCLQANHAEGYGSLLACSRSSPPK